MATIQKSTINDITEFVQYMPFEDTQSAANAFLEIPIPTGVTPDAGFILVLDDLSYELSSSNYSGTSLVDISVTLTKASKTAIPKMTDVDLLAKVDYKLGIIGTPTDGFAGEQWYPVSVPWVGKQIGVQEYLYLQLDTNGLNVAVTITGRLSYRTQKMDKASILEVLYG